MNATSTGFRITVLAVAIAASGCAEDVTSSTSLAAGVRASGARWQTVVSSNDVMPNSTTGRTFNSFNQPSVNAAGLVVFRARSRGGPPEGPPTRGIYVRDMRRGSAIEVIASGGACVAGPRSRSCVPDPNNLATPFIEFPSIPRIAIHTDAIVTRGNHQPVWATGETRAGTSGMYANLEAGDEEGRLLTAGSKLGNIAMFELFAVPGLADIVPFDVFPGAPSITDNETVAFKGNYTLTGGNTGVFYRQLRTAPSGGPASVQLVANSDTPIPNLADCASHARETFGSTAPPSAATDDTGDDHLVFVGLDDEASPRCGGIYIAELGERPQPAALIALGTDVPEVPGATFRLLGEGLSYDGRFVGFWAAWGTETNTVRLYCPSEGNSARIAYCNNELVDPATQEVIGDPDSICDDSTDATESCYQEKQVPVNQGIFVYDIGTQTTHLIARTPGELDDFVYWVYSGRVPTTGGSGDDGDTDDGEPARWRSSAFVAVSSRGGGVQVAFKARTGALDAAEHTWIDARDAILLARRTAKTTLTTLIDTRTPAALVDAQASPVALVTEVGLERDGLRDGWLAISARMSEEDGEEEEGLAGIYLTQVP